MQKQKKYNPFGIKSYYIFDNFRKTYLQYNKYMLELNKNGYIPKSGLLFDSILNNDNCAGKTVLDLGCGYLGILGIISLCNGALSVDAIDYDEKCVNWLKKIKNDLNISNLNCYCSNWFNSIFNKKYDLILSNPPQLPMSSGTLHDFGGKSGRLYIEKIISDAYNFLNTNGILYLLVFDFLGTCNRTNNDISIFEYANKIGYSNIELAFEVEKVIKKDSLTFKSLDYIKEIYPLYNFYTEDGTCRCNIQILKIQK